MASRTNTRQTLDLLGEYLLTNFMDRDISSPQLYEWGELHDMDKLKVKRALSFMKGNGFLIGTGLAPFPYTERRGHVKDRYYIKHRLVDNNAKSYSEFILKRSRVNLEAQKMMNTRGITKHPNKWTTVHTMS